jgi:hypothetical protein
MTTISAICNAFAPESLERSPHLPTAPHKVLSAIQHCRSGHDGHRLSQCQRCGKHHRGKHACGHRHCPQCQQHTTQQGFQHHLDKQLPGPHCLVTFTVPETRRPFRRSHPRLASQAMCTASSQALKRRAQEERFIGTNLPGFTGILHTWGRQRPYHPHIHSMVPGGGLSEDRTTWLPSRANFSVPVQALSPMSRALFKEAMDQAGLLEQIDPLVWQTDWNVHSQANPDGHTSFPYLAPYGFKGAISNSRIGALQDRTVTFTSRKRGSARLRTTHLDAMELLRRFLPHVWPAGFIKVRHFGFLHASCAIPPDTIRLLRAQAHPRGCQPTRLVPPDPGVAFCPTYGGPMRVVMRLWTANSALLDTGCEGGMPLT